MNENNGGTVEPHTSLAPQVENNWLVRRKYYTVLVLVIVNLLNYADRFSVAGVLSQLQNYFKINDQQSGLIQTVFIVFYMLFAPAFGYFGDRYNRKLIMSVGLLFWIISVLLSTLVGPENFKLFLFFRGLVGVGEASYSIVAPTIISDLFKDTALGTALMIFYFAIPVGSGLGYVGGSYFSLWTGSWQGGVRFTPILGFICLIAMQFFLDEPARGQVEHTQLVPSTLKDDLIYLKSVKIFRLICGGSTCVIFAVGALSWWTPNFIGYAYALEKGVTPTPEDQASVSLVFGLITCFAGVVGVILGTTISAAWKEGRWNLPINPYAKAHVCAIGSMLGIPFLFTCLLVARHSIFIAWILLFFAVTSMCMNWAINVEILLSIIVANRRATATAIQTLLSHLLGDAISPYIIGFISDSIRGKDSSYVARYYALQTSLFLPPFLLVLSGGFYLWIALDMEKSTQNTDQGDDVETLFENVEQSSERDNDASA